MVRVRVPSRSTLKPITPKRKSQKKTTVPSGLVLSATGGKEFFSSCMDMVKVHRACHDTDGYYRTLGVKSDSDEATIREAAKKRLMEAHPDHGGNEEEFIRAYEAYRTLCDPSARAEYDTRPPDTLLVTEVVREPRGFDIQPCTPPRGVRTAYYKEPDIIMSDEDEREVDAWAQYVIEAAQVRRINMQVKVGIRKSVKHQNAVEPGNVFVLQHGSKAKKYMAHILMSLADKQKRENYEFID